MMQVSFFRVARYSFLIINSLATNEKKAQHEVTASIIINYSFLIIN